MKCMRTSFYVLKTDRFLPNEKDGSSEGCVSSIKGRKTQVVQAYKKQQEQLMDINNNRMKPSVSEEERTIHNIMEGKVDEDTEKRNLEDGDWEKENSVSCRSPFYNQS